jgi:hypothetical protein
MNTAAPADWETYMFIGLGIVAAIAALLLVVVWLKGRPFATGNVYRASRFSKGNHLFPTQVLVSPTSVVQFTPQWVGKYEHSIHVAHIASVGIDTHLIFSDVLIETTGGADPIHCTGHYKSDAVRIKQLIEQHQNDYYRNAGQPAPAPVQAPAPPAKG